MKVTGFSAIILLCTLIFLCGCVQIIINPPQIPGATAPTVSPTQTLPAADDDPKPVVTKAVTEETKQAAVNPKYIVPVGDVTRVGHRTFTIYYGSGSSGLDEYNLRVPVNMSVLYGARQMNINLPASSMNPDEVRAYIDSFESDPAMEELYDSVLRELRSARYKGGDYLSDDEYIELIVAFVQQIPHQENPSPKRKYPVEVIYDKAGDSDEKSLLLVNLLAREGYDVSLLVFEDLGFETTGIRVVNDVPDSSLKVFTNGKKDYVMVDAYIPRFIGSVPDKPVDFASADDPSVYPVGNGTKSYGPINYVWKVVADLKRIRDMGKLTPEMQGTAIKQWDKTGTCSWIKNSKLLMNTTCYCCDM